MTKIYSVGWGEEWLKEMIKTLFFKEMKTKNNEVPCHIH